MRISGDFDISAGLKTRKVFSLAAKIISSQFYQSQRQCFVRRVPEMSWMCLISFMVRGLCGVNLHPLDPCTILDWGHLDGNMLKRDRFGVLVLCEGFVDVPGHVAIDMSLCVVPG